MATIRFFTRTITTDRNALVPIYVRIKSGRKIDLCCKADILIKPDNWSNETQKARQKADVFKFNAGESEEGGKQKFNDRIAGLRSVLESALELTHQEDITSEWLRVVIDKHWHPDKYRVNLFSFIDSFIEKSVGKPNHKAGKPVGYKTIQEYQVTFNYLKDYAKVKGIVIDFKDIDLNFYDGFTQYLQDKNLAVNTIGKKIQTLKIFLNKAKGENKNSYEVYKDKDFAAITEESESIYLNEADLTKLYEHDFSKNPALERVRDLFIVGCWTGCRFSDIAQITPENIIGGFIRIKQYKTGAKVVIPLNPVVTVILNKYGGRLPAAISNQKFNENLKTIARLAGIDEKTHKAITRGGVKVSTAYKKWELVTTHTARRSFATNLYLSDVPTLTIRAITGHKTESSFLKYIKVSSEEYAKKLQKHWEEKYLKVV